MTSGTDNGVSPAPHHALIEDQFSRQAELFANAPALHDEAALDALVLAATPKITDTALDVACGPGSVVAAFAARVHHATGLDATEAMLSQARKLGARQALSNVSWFQGDVCALPFENASFDIVSCRFAFHHFEAPGKAFAEMVRVCKRGGHIVLCDAVASEDAAKAKAFNDMERLRDPSTVAFRTLAFLTDLYRQEGLPAPTSTFYNLPVEMEALLRTSFPAGDDREAVRQSLREALEGDKMGIGLRRRGDTIRFDYPAAILVSTKP